MEDPRLNETATLIARQGPLTRDEARLLLDTGAGLLAAGDFQNALRHYWRVRGFDDVDVTAAALLGAGQALYRMDNESAAIDRWDEILKLPETPATYYAWRELAAARVREGDLQGAIAAYHEADRRAPPEDKAEIATRLGWLAKETGNVRASRRYFARGRGAVIPYMTYAILGITTAISLAALLSSEGGAIFDVLALYKPAVADGQYWRLWTVTLVHADFLHLAFNMYALYLAGPLVEQIYGPLRMLVVYLVTAAGASLASFAFSDGLLVVGASGAIFGLFGILFAASRMHLPMLDRRGRALLSQIGFLIVINIVIGFGLVSVDNVAHIGGLVTGLVMGIAYAPSGIETLTSRWQDGTDRPVRRPFAGSRQAAALSVAVIIVGFAVMLYIGLQRPFPTGP